MEASSSAIAEKARVNAKKIAQHVNARVAVTAAGFLIAVATAWAALLWVWYTRTIKIKGDPGANTDPKNKAECEIQATRANTKNLEGPMWLAVGGALAALALFIAGLAIPSMGDYLRKMKQALGTRTA